MLTDYVLGSAAAVFAIRLFALTNTNRSIALRLWAALFVATSAASFLGGTYHGFTEELSATALALLWYFTTLAVGIASFCFLTATIMQHAPARLRSILLLAAAVKLVVYSVWMMSHDSFLFVIAEYGISLLIVLTVKVAAQIRGRDPSAKWIIAAIAVAMIAAGIQGSRIRLHEHFNHNDLYHLIQVVSLYLFYRGARLVGDGPETRTSVQNSKLGIKNEE